MLTTCQVMWYGTYLLKHCRIFLQSSRNICRWLLGQVLGLSLEYPVLGLWLLCSVGTDLKELGGGGVRCRNVWNFALWLEFKADFYSKMSVCRQELVKFTPPPTPGNSNPALVVYTPLTAPLRNIAIWLTWGSARRNTLFIWRQNGRWPRTQLTSCSHMDTKKHGIDAMFISCKWSKPQIVVLFVAHWLPVSFGSDQLRCGRVV